ncbi:MAG TPA: helix-turn-helix transcriptional regulator [Chitinophaga sp.]|uniref:helix-turn-helix domain-containing protein n=1 Tax=Chitinophaga sp. TaxID=1869181 RepID=UPI002F94716F
MRKEAIEIGEKLRERRRLLGIKQPELAFLSGVSSRTIQQVENGRGNPSLETLFQLADPLGLRLELILKEPQKPADQ